ncbi:MAG: glutamine--fructose-6-phosphate transaminase (isomerizing) [Candidatus Anaerobiospirillum merdipullorum]|uniref:Glutamine--fructose-6-phosphate aminotransferase [isomerizing] n=1 Tax=Candidatus Anaerobiospirillum merdipullorum TaxID=2838450 RepID=A0A9E2KNE8_9GAMM|nr:glutamine--fructose-6-phosphate transaminase (isomerizing) [Candidatus Anaerobiospirillum merdipullorum]
MCGIVGAIAKRPLAEILLTGLSALEYRGYDSAGICFVTDGKLNLVKTAGKVQNLKDEVRTHNADGFLGIAHTRWATHGKPTIANAHPHTAGTLAMVHNGIIENYQSLKTQLCAQGVEFYSETDSEVLVKLINHLKTTRKLPLLEALHQALAQVHGAYAIALIDATDPDRLYVAKKGSPLIIGLGIGENFAASDVLALLPVTSRFIYLEDGDSAVITRDDVQIFDAQGNACERQPTHLNVSAEAISKGPYKHYMQKEIFEQPEALENTLLGRLGADNVSAEAFLNLPADLFASIKHVQIAACGTSYHAGLVGQYYLEEYAGVSTAVTIASEYRYKRTVVPEHSLFITLSQSGETADTLAALKLAKEQGYAATLCICNAANSSLVRNSDVVFLTRAGAEIGVASTKAFTTQLIALFLLTLALGRANGNIDALQGRKFAAALRKAPAEVRAQLALDRKIEALSQDFAGLEHALFLGRGPMFPIALEGALKLKEISYIHAEGYASGELKHGPIALIDAHMPVIVSAPNDSLISKLISNIEEVRARGGKLYIFAADDVHIEENAQCRVLPTANHEKLLAPITFCIPLQLLAYHVAVINGTDVDQPRNLAKSVTVE